MIYRNTLTNKIYKEGTVLTFKTNTGLFCGIPSDDQLTELGYELINVDINNDSPIDNKVKEIHERMFEILDELAATDYLAIKYIEGEDMSKYPNWKEHRHELRKEYDELENRLNELEN